MHTFTKCMDITELKKFPYFTGKMLNAFYKNKYPSISITRWLKHDKIKKIEKGKYTLHENPLIYATTLCSPSYCSLRSALSYYQLTNQIPIKIQVMTKKQKKSILEIDFITTPYMFGYKKEHIEGFDVFIAEKEKLLIDCVLYPKEGIMPNELQELLKEDLDLEKIADYLLRINNLNLIKRVGYLLEKNDKHIYSYFKKKLSESTNYPLLNPLLPKSKFTDAKWRLTINEVEFQ